MTTIQRRSPERTVEEYLKKQALSIISGRGRNLIRFRITNVNLTHSNLVKLSLNHLQLEEESRALERAR